MPVPWGALVAAGGSLLGGMLGRKKSSSEKKQAYYSEAMSQLALNDAMRVDRAGGTTHRIRMAAKDAKAAGLHPLFALGAAGGGGSPSFNIQGQSETGSAMGAGLADAAASAGAGLDKYLNRPSALERQQGRYRKAEAEALARRQEVRAEELHRANLDRLDAAATRDRSEAARHLNASIGKRAEQEANYRRPTPKVVDRDIIQKGPKGRRPVLNPELGLDELSQIRHLVEPWVEQFSREVGTGYRQSGGYNVPKASKDARRKRERRRQQDARKFGLRAWDKF